MFEALLGLLMHYWRWLAGAFSFGRPSSILEH